MADFCTLALTISVCLLILVIIFRAFGFPKVLEKIAAALERIADSLEGKSKVEANAGYEIRPDWYDRLNDLQYNYHPKQNGEAWYKADDVWACIEKLKGGDGV